MLQQSEAEAGAPGAAATGSAPRVGADAAPREPAAVDYAASAKAQLAPEEPPPPQAPAGGGLRGRVAKFGARFAAALGLAPYSEEYGSEEEEEEEEQSARRRPARPLSPVHAATDVRLSQHTPPCLAGPAPCAAPTPSPTPSPSARAVAAAWLAAERHAAVARWAAPRSAERSAAASSLSTDDRRWRASVAASPGDRSSRHTTRSTVISSAPADSA